MCAVDLAFILGTKVERAAATLPQSTQSALFTISGGRVVLTGIFGEVTAALQASGTDDTKLVVNPTVGVDADLTLALDIMGYSAVGTLFSVGSVGALLQHGVAAALMDQPVVLPVGTLDLNCAESKTGSIRWTLLYAPLDAEASVTAA